MSDNFLDEVYQGDTEGVFEDDDTVNTGTFFTYTDGSGDEVVFSSTTTGYGIFITTSGGIDVIMSMRGGVKDLIEALRAEYERVTGERI